jgi:hypothetical protein
MRHHSQAFEQRVSAAPQPQPQRRRRIRPVRDHNPR